MATGVEGREGVGRRAVAATATAAPVVAAMEMVPMVADWEAEGRAADGQAGEEMADWEAVEESSPRQCLCTASLPSPSTVHETRA